MKKINQSPMCYSLYCAKDSIPFYILLLLGSIGVLSAFLFDYILLIIHDLNGSFPMFCLCGIHIHHLYIGLIILLISSIMFFFMKNKNRIWIAFLMGLGFGLVLSDLISHLTIDFPFLIYC